MNSGYIARLFLLAVLFLLLPTLPAFAADIYVRGDCSLSEAITNANDDAATNSDCEAGSGADTIVLTRKVELSANAPDITGTLTINGRGQTIDGMEKYRPINIETTGADVTIHDITITRGSSVTLAQGHKAGGAIRLTLPSSPDTQNASLTLTRVRIINNASATNGGAIACTRANLTISDSVFANNSAEGQGGALNLGLRCAVTIRRSAFHGNSAPGTSGFGGAITTHNGTQSILIVNSTFYNNRAGNEGGAINLNGDVYDAPIKLHHLTITGNSTTGGRYKAAGIMVRVSNSAVNLRNSIIWGNTGSEQCGTTKTGGLGAARYTNNIVQAHDDDNCGTASNADPRLPSRPTGSIPYFALPDGSPAINIAPDCSALTTEDQRGRPRPYPTGGRCDAGAYEWHPPPPRKDDEESGNGSSGSEEQSSRETDTDTNQAAALLKLPTCLTLPDHISARNITHSTQCRQVGAAGVGNAAVLGLGFRDGVDVWGWVLPDMQICFEGNSGSFRFLDAATAPRAVSELPAVGKDGMICTTINRAGTVALVDGPPAPMATAIPPHVQSLSGCMVRTQYMLNFRAAPDGEIIDILPFNIKLTALQRSEGYFKVDYMGARGWISENLVEPIGTCG